MPLKIIITVLVIAVAGFLLLSTNVGKTAKAPSQQPSSKVVATITPAPTSVHAGTVQGTVASVDGDTLVVTETGGDKTVSLAGTSDFQKVVSGSIKAGNPVFAAGTRADLATGKHVIVAIDEKTGAALTVIISP